MAVNYLAVHQLQEMMNPGYLRRSERRMQQQTGQTYWLSPSRAQQSGIGSAITAPRLTY